MGSWDPELPGIMLTMQKHCTSVLYAASELLTKALIEIPDKVCYVSLQRRFRLQHMPALTLSQQTTLYCRFAPSYTGYYQHSNLCSSHLCG